MKTALYERHLALGAKIVPFAGWEMPVQYKGIVAEHMAVREAVGLFDVSHMGRIFVEGDQAESFLDYLSTNKIVDKPDGSATYTVWCDEKGHCVDDVIIYKYHSRKFCVVANAGNRQKDLKHMQEQAKNFRVVIQDRFEEEGILALQGPKAEALMSQFCDKVKELKPMHFLEMEGSVIARTGYTGAGGFEIAAPNKLIVEWWDRLLEKGKEMGIMPVGLGARDTLRLEMGFALYGHEIDETISPNESVASWTIKWDKGNFIGKQSLEALEQSGAKRKEYGIRMIDKIGIPRQGCSVLLEGKTIGKVTSGSFSPVLNESIAIILVQADLKPGDQVEIQIRQQVGHAQVVQLPFVRKQK